MNQFNQIPDILFSGLGKDYCFIFNIFTFLSLLTLSVFAVNIVSNVFGKKGKGVRFGDIILFSLLFISYLRDRVFYSMCVN